MFAPAIGGRRVEALLAQPEAARDDLYLRRVGGQRQAQEGEQGAERFVGPPDEVLEADQPIAVGIARGVARVAADSRSP